MSMKKLKDMKRDELAKLATECALPGRSKMNVPTLVQALTKREQDMRVARFGVNPQEPEGMTPKQARRVKQKMNRER
jgi:hypothetical protein